MLTRVSTAYLNGLNFQALDVEIELRNGQSGFKLLGLADRGQSESRQRIISAFRSLQLKLPANILINLYPNNLKKTGAVIDLALALGIMQARGWLKQRLPENCCVIGALGIDARVHKIPGLLALVLAAKKEKIVNFIVAHEALAELCEIAEINVCPLKNLKDCQSNSWQFTAIENFKPNSTPVSLGETEEPLQIIGQKYACRAVEIAAAGGHHLLLQGPPGVGKTTVVRFMQKILPPLSPAEQLELLAIYSLADLPMEAVSQAQRQFRSPAVTAPLLDFIGGKKKLFGEFSLAHNGVMFLDELALRSNSIIAAMRLPLEEGVVVVSGVMSSALPARFQLVAAMNLCPCGASGQVFHQCRCSANSIRNYYQKISAPILDRIDLQVSLSAHERGDLIHSASAHLIDLSKVRRTIAESRLLAVTRQNCANANMNDDQIRVEIANLSSKALLDQLIVKRQLSLRKLYKIIKVARTIADLAYKPRIEDEHLAEAFSFCLLDLAAGKA